MTDEALLDSSQSAFEPLGEVLLAARKAKKLTQKDVSNSLRLSVKQISELENNEFHALPQPMITRGFIRNYARLLELDAEPLLDSYRRRVPENSPNALSVKSSMYQVMSGKESQPWLKYILGSILVLLFLLAWIFYIDYMPKSSKFSPETRDAETVVLAPTTTEVTLPEAALPIAERQAEQTETAQPLPEQSATPVSSVPVVADASQTKAAEALVSANTVATKEKAQPLVSATQSVNQAPANSTPVVSVDAVPLSASKKISMTFSEKTWVQATDKSGAIVYERILAAGSTDGFDGQPPFNLVIGNAKATKLSYMGKSVDLSANTTENNVARIKLE